MMNFLKKIDDLNLGDLSRGICSKNNLYRIRNGERDISAVFFYHIIRRLYISPERFQIMIDANEYNYFSWIYNVKSAVAAYDFSSLSKLCSKSQEKMLKDFQPVVNYELAEIRGILYLEEQDNLTLAYKEFKRAVDYMTAIDLTLLPGRYGIDEYNRYMNYLKVSVLSQQMSKECAKEEFDRIFRMAALKERDPREEAKLYPRIICFMLNTVGDMIPFEIQKKMLLQALECLRKTYECYDLTELLRLLIIAAQNIHDPETDKYCHWYESVCDVFRIAQYNTGFNWYDSHDGACQLYLIHEYLRRSRENTKISQGEISAGIMDPFNYSRLESGKHRPRKQHYEELTKKMGVRSDFFRGEIITDDPENFNLMTEIRRASNASDSEKLKVYLKLLSESLDRSHIENAQFLDQKQVDLDLLTGKITIEDSIQKLIDILEYTTPYKPNETHVFSYLEEETIYKIIRNKRICGTLNDEDVEILRGYLKSEENSEVLFWPRTIYAKRLLAGILQTQGKLEDSEKLSEECLSDMVKAGDAGVMIDCLDILAESILEKDRLNAQKLIKVTFWLCDLYQAEDNKKIISKYYLRVFGENMVVNFSDPVAE